MRSLFSNLRGDFFGGITAGIVALPLALAFGVQSGLGAVAGLYGAIILGILAALFGGTKTQVSGPTGPMTVVSAALVADAIALNGSLSEGMGFIIGAFLLAGLFQISLGLLRIGSYVKYIPYPVVSGFMTGIGLIIIIYQLFPLFGYSAKGKSTTEILLTLHEALGQINLAAFGLAALTVALIYGLPYLSKRLPAELVALVGVTLLSKLINLDVPRIGEIPSGLPSLKWESLLSVNPEHYWDIAEMGAILATLGAIDSLLTSVIADNITKTKHRSNLELIGQGIGNAVAGLFGGLPGAGATMRTVININAGGREKLSGFFHGVFLLVVLLGLGRYAAYIPLSVLAGILLTVGIGIIDYRGLRHLVHVPRPDAVVLLLVLFITVFGNLLHAVGVGVVLACILFMKMSGDLAEKGMSSGTLAQSEESPWRDEREVQTRFGEHVLIKHLYGPLFFGFTHRFQEMLKKLDPEIAVLIIRMDRVPHIDQSGMYAFEEALLDLKSRNIVVVLSGIAPQPLDMLRRIEIVPKLVPEENIFQDFGLCKEYLLQFFAEEKG